MSLFVLPLCRFHAPLLAGIVLLSAFFSAPSLAEDVFTVKGVKVDVTAENAVAAREKAFNEAQLAAFKALSTRLAGDADAKALNMPDVSVISAMLQDFEITAEQLSAVEYIGTYTFRFDGPAVRRFFNMKGVSYSDVASRPVLVLPFYQMGTHAVLWREDNPFLAAWGRSNVKGGLVPVTVPMGDIRDIGDISDDQVLTYRASGLATMVQRYGAGEAIILVATPETDTTLNVLIYRTDRSMPEHVKTLRVEAGAGSTPDALFDRAVIDVRAALQQEWKAQTAVHPAMGNTTIRARAQYSTMQQWIETRNAIRRIQGIGAMKILTVTPREAQFELEFAGDENRLRAALDQQEIMLLPPEVEYAYSGAPALYTLYLKKYAH